MRVYTPPKDIDSLRTTDLRSHFLVNDLFKAGEIRLACLMTDRLILGGVVPQPEINVIASANLQGSFFNNRREAGLINIGDDGSVVVDGKSFEVGHLDCLYLNTAVQEISFRSRGSGKSEFYLLSCPAHRQYPTCLARQQDAAVFEIGDPLKGSRRKISRYIHEGGIQSCQLVMGFTELEQRSLWNTWPPHTHLRRSEVYLYFDLGSETVLHLLGEPTCTRHLVVRDRQAVLSPPWSIHCGVGTSNYRFIWGMAGENRVFEDMDPVSLDAFQ